MVFLGQAAARALEQLMAAFDEVRCFILEARLFGLGSAETIRSEAKVQQ